MLVGIRVFGMLAAVDLQDQPPFDTAEIHDEWWNRKLAAKFAPQELTVAQAAPQRTLGVRQIPPQASGNGRGLQKISPDTILGTWTSDVRQVVRQNSHPHPNPLPQAGEGAQTLTPQPLPHAGEGAQIPSPPERGRGLG
jgi:hypothetical protein